MIRKFCGIFTHSYSTPPQHGSSFGLEVVAAWFTVPYLKLEGESRPYLQIIVYIYSQLSGGYLKD